MKATFTKAVLTLALIGIGAGVGTASAHERGFDRGGKGKDRYEHRWERDHRHFDRKGPHVRHHDKRIHRHAARAKRGHDNGVIIIFRSIF